MSSAGFETRIEYRSLVSGWEGVIQRDDGSAIKVWGPTRDAAERRVEALLAEGV